MADESDDEEAEAETSGHDDGEAGEPSGPNDRGTVGRPASQSDDKWAWRDPGEDHILGDEADDFLAEVSDQRSGATHGAEVWGSDGGFGPEPVIADSGFNHRLRTRRLIRSVVETTLLAILVFLSVRASFQNFRVDGASMSPTLADGEFLLVNKLVYAEIDIGKLAKFVPFFDANEDGKQFVFHGPERGDVIVLRDPRPTQQDLIKRIIGLPGETVEIRQGKVFINDRLLEEPYIRSPWSDTRPKIAIPEGHYYVLGDNRSNSLDSRAVEVGLIPDSLVIGKALLTYWPFERFGLAPNSPGTSGGPVLTASDIREFLPDTTATTR